MLCMTGIHASKRRKEVACLELGGWGGGHLRFLSGQSDTQCCSAHVLHQNNTHSLLKKSLFHTSLSLHISHPPSKKEKINNK